MQWEVHMGSRDFILQWPILDDDHVVAVYEFLQDFMRAFESDYGAQLNAYYCEMYANDTQGNQRSIDDEIPF